MKKIILLFVVVCLFLISGCNCNKNNSIMGFYDEEVEWKNYLEQFYQEINTEGAKYAAFDLRSKETYETEHLRHFQNYDLTKGSVEEFNSYLTKNYSGKYTIYIYIETLSDLNYFDVLLDKYKDVYVYIGDYATFRNLGDELFTFDTGQYDCNC